MTTRYKRNKTLMVKIETTYGVDAVPTGAANAVLCKTDVNVTPLESERVPREVIQAYMGHQQDLPVATRMKIEFDIERPAPAAPSTCRPPGDRCCAAAASRRPSTRP
jgi:hypothetical protein